MISNISDTKLEENLDVLKNSDQTSLDALNLQQLVEQTLFLSKSVEFENFLPADKKKQKELIKYSEIAKKASLVPGAIDFLLENQQTTRVLPTIQPHMQLYLAFLQLLNQPRRQFQNLIRKHRDFYYKEILKFENHDAISDNAYLIFELEEGVEETILEKGTQLTTVPEDERQPLTYALLNDIKVNRATITQVRSILAESFRVHVVYEVANSNLQFPLLLSAPGELSNLPPDDPNASYSMATIYLSSPLLWLQNGRREITIKAEQGGPNPFENLYRLEISTEDGWQRIDHLGKTNRENTGYKIQSGDEIIITLDRFFPPVTTYPEGDGVAFDNPVLKFTPRAKTTLSVSEAKLSVCVEGLTSLLLENGQGEIPNDAPLELFGFEPVVGTFFRFGAPEITQKPLQRLSLNTRWIPGAIPNKGDYPDINDIYAYYPAPDNPDALIKNTNYNGNVGDYFSTFKTTLSVRYTNGQMLPEEEPQKLFSPFQFTINAPLQKEGQAIESYQLTFTHGNFLYEQYITAQNEQAQYQSQITTNDYLIGVYNSEISVLEKCDHDGSEGRIAQLKAEIELLKKQNKTLDAKLGTVYPPYNPATEPVLLNYTTHAESSSFQFFNETGELAEAGTIKPNESPQMLIRLAPVKTFQMVSLLIAIADFENPDSALPQEQSPCHCIEPDPLELRFQYYNNKQQWENIEYSTPEGPQNPYYNKWLVTLLLPLDIKISGDDQGCWIKATFLNAKTYRNLQVSTISTQAVLAGRLLDGPESEIGLDEPLTPMSIKDFVVARPDIRAVFQPFPSFGGRQKQTDRELSVQASLRLHHRQRAVTPLDYETLVLEKFQSIREVCCINATTLLQPGHIVIEVIPRAQYDEGGLEILLPLADVALLQEIKEYIEQFSPPLAKVCVSNPNYNQVMLEIEVDFEESQTVDPKKELHQAIIKELEKQLLSPQKYPLFFQQVNEDAVWLALAKKPYIKKINRLSIVPKRDDLLHASRYVYVPATQHIINSKKRGHYE